AVLGQWLCFESTNALEIPAGRTLHDASKAELAFEPSMDIHSYLAATLLWSFEVAAFQCVRPASKLDRIPPLGGLEPREANIAPSLAALKKRGECPVQSLHYLVGNDGWHVRVGRLVVLLVLFVDVQVLSSRLEVRFPLGKRIVVQATGGR